MIVSSAKSGTYFRPHLATHGFVVVGIDRKEPKKHWGRWLIDYSLDQVAAIEYVAKNPVGKLNGMLDVKKKLELWVTRLMVIMPWF